MRKKRYRDIENLVRRIVPLLLILLSVTTLFGQYHITGTITDEDSGDPVPGVSVYFYLPGGGPLGGSMSDQTGVYNFHTDNVAINDVLHLQAWSFCNDGWETYNYFFTILSDTTNYSFQVCSDEEPCSADFDFEIDNLEVEFINLSVGPVYEFYWDFGDGGFSYAEDPAHTYELPGQYEVSLFISAENNCYDALTQFITVGENYTISGTAFVGNTPLPQGEILLFEVGTTMDIRQRHTLDETGEYSFSVEPYSDYLLLVLPDIDPGVPHFPVYMPTYHNDVMQWQQADPIHASEDIETDIHLQHYDEMFHGSGTITGQVTMQDKAFNDMPIFLKDEGGNYVDYCFPSLDGAFSFSEIPVDSYIIFPEKAGKNTDPGFVSLSAEEPSANEIKITETEHSVEVEYNVGLSSFQENSTRIFPVPAHEVLSVESEMNIKEVVIFSILGKQIASQDINETYTTINTSLFKNGVYLLHLLYDDTSTETRRIVVSH